MPDIDITAVLTNVNYPAAGAAGLAGFAFGVVWRSVLGKPWRAALDRPPPADGKPPFKLLGLALAANMVMAAIFYGIMLHINVFSPGSGIFSAVLIWIGFAVTIITVNYAFQGCRPALILIDSGHWLGVLIVQGAVLGALGN